MLFWCLLPYRHCPFPEGLTPKDFIDGAGYSVKRNPLLAQLMYYVKDIESFGTGLKRIHDACESAGVKVEFLRRRMGFSVVFYRPDVYSDGIIGENIGENIGVNIGENIGKNDTQTRILAIMNHNPRISAKAIAGEIGLSPRYVEASIQTLKKAGLVERVGPAKCGRWSIKKPE